MKKRVNKKLPIILIATLLIAVAAGGWYYWQKEKNEANTVIVADESFTDGTEREPSTDHPPRDGGIIDTSGEEGSENVDESSSVSSKSGKITVYQPGANSVLEDGASINGKSSYDRVSYRLIDDKIGVVGTGSLGVVNGKFSGKFSFSSNGNEGRLDVFQELSDGREVDVVEIPVRFK